MGIHGAGLGRNGPHTDTMAAKRQEMLLADVNDQLQTQGILVGAERVVVVLTGEDFSMLLAPANSSAFAETTKIIFAKLGEKDMGIAHELAHTLPAYLWSSDGMEAECGQAYHWSKANIAHGFRIVKGGALQREPKLAEIPIMGDGEVYQMWITQCSYWHLIDALRNRKDPALILVRGRLARNGPTVIGELFPAYQSQSVADTVPAGGADWAMVLRDASGAEMARYPFQPEWELPSPPSTGAPVERDVITFGYQIPDLPQTARIDLVGPSGLLDSLEYSANPPAVSITEPLTGPEAVAVAGKVHVEWDGADPDGDSLLYSTLYSTDRGESWQFGTFEQTAPEVDLPVDLDAPFHMVKVIATDGARSTEATVEFSILTFLTEPPTPMPTPAPTPTPTVTPTPPPTLTPTPVPTATSVPTPAPTPVPPPAPTRVPTPAPTPPAVRTEIPKGTPAPKLVAAPTASPVPALAPARTATPFSTPAAGPTPTTTPVGTGTGACSAPVGGGAKADLSLLALLTGLAGMVVARRKLPGR